MCGPSRSKLEIGQRQLGDVKVLPNVESFLVKSLVNGFGSYGESDVMVQDISGPFSSSNRPRQLSPGNLKQCDLALSHLVLQGLVRRTGMGPRTGPDCNWFKGTNGPGPLNFLRKTRKDPGPKTGSGSVQDRTEIVGL